MSLSGVSMRVLTFTQASVPSSLYSTQYPIILEPPSFRGGIHVRSTVDLLQSETFGVGGVGGAVGAEVRGQRLGLQLFQVKIMQNELHTQNNKQC